MNIDLDKIKEIVNLSLREDSVKQDITSKALLNSVEKVKFKITAKENGILCGMPVVKFIYENISKKIKFTPKFSDGSSIKKGCVVSFIEGECFLILSAERVALNFLSHLSGIATLTKKFTQKVSNYNVKIYDTRKTLPGLRYLEKYAVRMAGGFNHRMDLKSMFMVKDNHINILRKVFKNSDYDSLIAKMKKKYPCKDVEIEVENFMQFKKALKSYPDIIMLDNMKPDKILKCIKEKEKFSQQDEKVKKIILEASGGINIDNVKKTAATGVDRISIGSLTNSAVSLDFSMELS